MVIEITICLLFLYYSCLRSNIVAQLKLIDEGDPLHSQKLYNGIIYYV